MKCEWGDMEMVGLRMWVMAMDERETTLKLVTEKYERLGVETWNLSSVGVGHGDQQLGTYN